MHIREGRPFALLLMLCIASAEPAGAQRGMTPEDLFRIEEIGSVVWSPDGRFAAVEITPAGSRLGSGVPTSQIWMVDSADRSFRLLTGNLGPYTGYWRPVWSPSGKRLAFLSVDSEAAIRPWVWDAGSSTPSLLESLDVQVNYSDPPLLWASDDEALVLAWSPEAQRSGSIYYSTHRSHYAPELWRRARRGEASVTVLESGGSGPPAGGAQVVAVNVARGTREILVRGAVHRLSLSPDRRMLAYFRENPGVPSQSVASFLAHEELYDNVNWGSELHLYDLARRAPLAGSADLLDPGYESLNWSAAGQLALPGRRTDDVPGWGWVLFRQGKIERLEASGLERVTAAAWLGEHLVVRANATGSPRRDWWLVLDGRVTNLTSGMENPPSTLVPVGQNALLGAAGGEFWRISREAAPVRLAGSPALSVSGLRSVDTDRGLLLATLDGRRVLLRVVGDSVQSLTLEEPPPGTTLRGISPAGNAALYQGDSKDGTRLWLLGAADRSRGGPLEVWRGNEWVGDVTVGRSEFIRYTGTNGAPLGGWLLMPPNSVRAEPLPLVMQVYPGAVYREEDTPPFALLSGDFLHPQIFAARGYAVFLPSMPVSEDPLDAGPLQELTIGVLPALDTLVSRGIADSRRLAIVGQSAGGYATLGLVGQTTRFRAAIASASYSNLVSLYGTFYGQRRYGDAAHPQTGQVLRMMQMERGYGRMGGPPWERLERYLRNSPLLDAGKVTTPVMLVHGDMDFIPIQQAEEFFTALYRQDKRARFVRYHGEGHTPTSRANILDLWARMEDWLGEMLAHTEQEAP